MLNQRLQNLKYKTTPYLFITPTLIFFLAILGFPILFSFSVTFFNWVGNKPPFLEFIGLKNYYDLFRDINFYTALKNTFIFTIGTVIFQNLIAYIIALLFYFGRFKFENIIKTTVFFPAVLAPVVVSLVWKNMLLSDGFVNYFLNAIKLGIFAKPWLMQFNILMWILVGINVWQYVGYNMIIFYAGLQSIDPQVIEAATIDGAGLRTLITRVVTPIIKPTIILAVILTTLGGFKVFDIVFIFTKGGPIHLTEVITTYLYFLSFDYTAGLSKFSYSSTMIFASMFIVFIIGIIRYRVTIRKVT